MRPRLQERLGALVERQYRLLFAATLTTSLGDAIALIALAFAVLEVGSATDLGIVVAVQAAVSAGMLLVGGVASDRFPRNRVLVIACLLQATAQAGIAAAVLTGHATLGVFVALSVVYGLGDGLVIPAEMGLIPQTVRPGRLQQANALQGLSRSAVRVIGPAIGGLLVVAASPGWALAVDSVSFLACALLLAKLQIPPRAQAAAESFAAQLRGGWREFMARTWLWSTVLLFGLGNLVSMFWTVLGPAISQDHLGGAGAWAVILTAGGAGALLGGLAAIRYRPRRPMVACILWPLTNVPRLAAMALGAPTWVIAAASVAAGAGLAIHLTLWFTVFQREVPEHAQSRVASYDALGSFLLAPLGAAIAGPLAVAIGSANALWVAAGVLVACNSAMLLIPAVWRLGLEPASAQP